ncbi:MAG: LD-carboxypeptidase [Clostridiales bacterium]|jgi:muramoyltetrapeptide carboxypeptidase LdcA involved in peptidoglycan recycling|nr:LD-carboxypeptidase [Clostridiales bacterium]
MIKPACLKRGDKVCAISLSSGLAQKYPHRYHVGKRQIERTFDIEIVQSANALREDKWLQQNPKARADDLMAALLDDSISGIFSIIGGFDSIKLLPFLDFNVIKNNPKIFLGNSDATVTHFVFSKCGIVSYYGPSIMTGLAENGGIFEYTADYLQKALFCNQSYILVQSGYWVDEFLDWANPSNQEKNRTIKSNSWQFLQGDGIVEGELFGGCPEVIDKIKDTVIFPDMHFFENKILFLEISEEMPHVSWFENFLRDLGNRGILNKIKAILFGRPHNYTLKYEKAMLNIVNKEFDLNTLPIITRMDFGHTEPSFVLPYGLSVRIDFGRKCVVVANTTYLEVN